MEVSVDGVPIEADGRIHVRVGVAALVVQGHIDIINRNVAAYIDAIRNVHNIKERVRDIAISGNVQDGEGLSETYVARQNLQADVHIRMVPDVPDINVIKNIVKKIDFGNKKWSKVYEISSN